MATNWADCSLITHSIQFTFDCTVIMWSIYSGLTDIWMVVVWWKVSYTLENIQKLVTYTKNGGTPQGLEDKPKQTFSRLYFKGVMLYIFSIGMQISQKYFSQGTNKQKTSIGSDNGLAPTRRQTIIWTNDDLLYGRIYMSLDLGDKYISWGRNCIAISPISSLDWNYDDVIKWKHFPRNWPFVRGIHRSRWIPHTKASDAELWCFLSSASE